MYKFVKFKSKNKQNDSGQWWFAAETIQQVNEHYDKVFKPTIQEAYNQLASDCIDKIFRFGDSDLMNHPTGVAAAIYQLTEIKYQVTPFTLFETANNMLMTALNNRLREIADGKTIYLEDGVKEFGFNESQYEIVETVEKNELVYPDFIKPTIDDVRFIQWPNGEHWYAKVNKEDIVDAAGNQKWNTKEDAKRAAEWYLETYYPES